MAKNEGRPKALPALCRKCARPKMPLSDNECVFCRYIEFHESNFCDLNRSVQSPNAFKCHAFTAVLKPVISLVPSVGNLGDGKEGNRSDSSPVPLLESDKLKYRAALALQRLEREPDAVFAGLKYHLAWNVGKRIPIFAPPVEALEIVNDGFRTSDGVIGGFARVIWLAPDHIHVYVESDGEKSVEEIVRTLKRLSEAVLREEMGSGKSGNKKGKEIWDRAYFAETLG